jgi:hypothetical protein
MNQIVEAFGQTPGIVYLIMGVVTGIATGVGYFLGIKVGEEPDGKSKMQSSFSSASGSSPTKEVPELQTETYTVRLMNGAEVVREWDNVIDEELSKHELVLTITLDDDREVDIIKAEHQHIIIGD